MKIVLWVLVGAITVLAVLLGPILYWMVPTAIENSRYAARVFLGVVDYDEVLASRRFSAPLLANADACIYAVVSLSEAPPQVPAESDTDGIYSFGGDWMRTPVPVFDDTMNNGCWSDCRNSLDPDLVDRMINAMTAPGGWWIGEERIFMFYSSVARLSFRLEIEP